MIRTPHHRLSYLGLAATALVAVLAGGCSSAPVEPAPSVNATALTAQTSVAAGSGAASRGIARYQVAVLGEQTTVRLIDAGGRSIGEIVTYAVQGGRHLAYSHQGVQIEFEYAGGEIAAWVNGQSRGTKPLDMEAIASGAASPTGAAFDMADVASDLRLLASVASDGPLQEAIKGLRQGVPYAYGLPPCPWWVWLGSCVAIETVPGGVICGACFIAWL